MSDPHKFAGHDPRACGRHIWPLRDSAWCLDCDEICYRDQALGSPCEGCRLPTTRAVIAALEAEVVRLQEALATAEAKVVRVEALAESLVWKRPDKCPCDDPESCCGSEYNCSAMRLSVSVVGEADFRAALGDVR